MGTRRGTPEVLVAAMLALLLFSYFAYSLHIIRGLRDEARRSSLILGRAIQGLTDTTAGAESHALLDIVRAVREQGVPTIIVSPRGVVSDKANLPFDPDDTLSLDDPRVRAYIDELDRANPPLVDPVVGTVHFGHTRVVRGLRIIPMLQLFTGGILLVAFVYVVRTRMTAARERLWAGMARETAHQIGTPLSSLTGWIELIEERSGPEPQLAAAVGHMRGDLQRLDRVAHRFERIGREPRQEPIDIAATVDRIVGYFSARVPTLAKRVSIAASVDPDLPAVTGDPILLDWALEVLVKNAIDALSGRGGTVTVAATAAREGGVAVRVTDDGPGIRREDRARVFEPGFSTKKGGWGIGLALAKRIVEENHSGTLTLLDLEPGATFEIILR